MRIGRLPAAVVLTCVLGSADATPALAVANASPSTERASAAVGEPLTFDAAAVSRVIHTTLQKRRVPGAGAGIVAGDRLVFGRAFGRLNDAGDRVRLDSLFQIGSITKTFVATLLCALRDEGVVRLDDPVERYLSDVTLPHDPAGAPAITLRHLVTHTSGLPANPVNRRDLPGSPSVMLPYSVEELRAGLAATRLDAPVGTDVGYSNLGFGLLGHALERAAGADLESLLVERVAAPLGLADTRVTLSAEDEERLAAHYWPGAPDVARPRWRFGEVSGFGGLTSNVPDLARYLAFHLGALKVDRAPVSPATLREMHRPQRIVDSRWNRGVGLAWVVEPTDDHGPFVYHGGELDGHSSFLGFLPDHGVGVVVLANQGGSSAEFVGKALVKEILTAVRAELDTVTSLLNDRRWDDALPLVRALSRRNPLDGRSAFRLGMVLLEADLARADGDPRARDEARGAFEAAHRLGFDRPEAAFGIARCHARAGANEAALDALREAYRAGFRDGRTGATSEDFDALHGDPRFRSLIAEHLPGIGPLFLDVIDGGAPAALDERRTAGLSESDVNRLGYQLLSRGRTDDAIAVFRFNVTAHPESWNVYDSLGEAYMQAGETETSIKHYERSVRMNPNNANGRRMLERLRASAGGVP